MSGAKLVRRLYGTGHDLCRTISKGMLLLHLALIDGESGHSALLRRSVLMRPTVQDLTDMVRVRVDTRDWSFWDTNPDNHVTFVSAIESS